MSAVRRVAVSVPQTVVVHRLSHKGCPLRNVFQEDTLVQLEFLQTTTSVCGTCSCSPTKTGKNLRFLIFSCETENSGMLCPSLLVNNMDVKWL